MCVYIYIYICVCVYLYICVYVYIYIPPLPLLVPQVQAGKGLQPSRLRFTVSPHHQEVELSVERGFGQLSFAFRSQLIGASHWGASLPLPAPVYFEIRRANADDQVRPQLGLNHNYYTSKVEVDALGVITRSILRSAGPTLTTRCGPPYMLNTQHEETHTGFYSYLACFVKLFTLNMYVSMSYTGLARRNTLFIFLRLRHRNT